MEYQRAGEMLLPGKKLANYVDSTLIVALSLGYAFEGGSSTALKRVMG